MRGGSRPRHGRVAARRAATRTSVDGWREHSGPAQEGTKGIEATGRQIGRELAPTDASASAEAFETSLIALGFQPTMERVDADRTTFCLGNCPYRDAVNENQPAICALHRGITRGLLDALAPEAKLAAYVPRDPDQAGCKIEIRGLEPAAPARRRGA